MKKTIVTLLLIGMISIGQESKGMESQAVKTLLQAESQLQADTAPLFGRRTDKSYHQKLQRKMMFRGYKKKRK